MIYLILAIASSAMVSIFMRLSEGKVKGNVSMLAMNYLACLTVAGCYMGFGNIAPAEPGLGLTAAMGAFNGLLYLLGFVLLKLNIRKNGVVMSATFMKLGLLVPMVVSIGLFGEMPDMLQLLGFIIAVGAIILINFEKEETTMEFKAGLILLLLAGGGGDAMSKVFEGFGNSALSEQFLFYTFVTAFLLCVGLTVYQREKPGIREVSYGLLVGVPNYFSARFLLKAVESLAAVIVYPTVSVATIVVITLAGVCFFKERLGRRQWAAIGMILAALVLLNV